jgi:chromosome segregation ATPase
MQEDEKNGYVSRVELLDELHKLKQENQELQKQKKQLDIVIERYEKDLEKYQTKQWSDESYLGRSKYNQKLIKEFQKRKEIRKEMLLGFMNINPSNKDQVKALNAMIDDMERLGFIKDMGGKWRWLL